MQKNFWPLTPPPPGIGTELWPDCGPRAKPMTYSSCPAPSHALKGPLSGMKQRLLQQCNLQAGGIVKARLVRRPNGGNQGGGRGLRNHA